MKKDTFFFEYPILPLLVACLAIVFMAPYGDFPVNDDWQYARVVKNYFDTGEWNVDVPIAPSLLIQGLISIPFLKIFGFSHLLLRSITIACSLLSIFLFDRILKIVLRGGKARAALLLILTINPLFYHFACSYMTEIYGITLALASALLWFKGREKAIQENKETFLPTPYYLLASTAVAALSFWTRQFSAVIYPVLVGASFFGSCFIRQDWKTLKRDLPPLLISGISFFVIVALYFVWAKFSGNYRPEFSTPLDRVLKIDFTFYFMHPGFFIFYMTFFFYPLLFPLFFRKVSLWQHKKSTFIIFSLLVCSIGSAVYIAGDSFNPFHNVSSSTFPFIYNVMFNAGIGPITLTDVFFEETGVRPSHPTWIWQGLQWTLFVSSFLWIPFLSFLRKEMSDIQKSIDPEFLWFGLLFTVGNFFAIGQAYGTETFDRYYFPCFLGIILLFAIYLKKHQGQLHRILPATALLALPLCWYTVSGMHDFFEWNVARWELYKHARSLSISPLNIDGGYEVNGWENYDLMKSANRKEIAQCIGECKCGRTWYCFDDSYRITMSVPDGYRPIEKRLPDYWLANGPPLFLSQRVETPTF